MHKGTKDERGETFINRRNKWPLTVKSHLIRLSPMLKADSKHRQEGCWKHYVETTKHVLRWSIMENDTQAKVKMLSHNTRKLRYSRKTYVMNSWNVEKTNKGRQCFYNSRIQLTTASITLLLLFRTTTYKPLQILGPTVDSLLPK